MAQITVTAKTTAYYQKRRVRQGETLVVDESELLPWMLKPGEKLVDPEVPEIPGFAPGASPFPNKKAKDEKAGVKAESKEGKTGKAKAEPKAEPKNEATPADKDDSDEVL